MGTRVPVPAPQIQPGNEPMSSPAPPQYSRDPVREEEWQQYRSDLARVQRELDQPFLSVIDGDRILELMTRLCDLLRREQSDRR